MPIQESAITSSPTSWNVTPSSNGNWDIAYGIWFNPRRLKVKAVVLHVVAVADRKHRAGVTARLVGRCKRRLLSGDHRETSHDKHPDGKQARIHDFFPLPLGEQNKSTQFPHD
jgi:hypothetical protein